MTCCSSIASSSALCVFGPARLISSASSTWANTGPGWKTKASRAALVDADADQVGRHQVGGELRAREAQARARPRARARGVVLPTPGTSSIRRWPPARRQATQSSICGRLPTMIVLIWSTSSDQLGGKRSAHQRRTYSKTTRVKDCDDHGLSTHIPIAAATTWVAGHPGVPAAARRDRRPSARHGPRRRARVPRGAAGRAAAISARAQPAGYVAELQRSARAVAADGRPARSTPTRSPAPAPGTRCCAPPARRWPPPTRSSTARSRNAFCAVRPPGHHATRDQAMGFCFFNNVAVAARHALDVRGLERVADRRLRRAPRQRHRGHHRGRRARADGEHLPAPALPVQRRGADGHEHGQRAGAAVHARPGGARADRGELDAARSRRSSRR